MLSASFKPLPNVFWNTLGSLKARAVEAPDFHFRFANSVKASQANPIIYAANQLKAY
jgi:hypothetical protein